MRVLNLICLCVTLFYSSYTLAGINNDDVKSFTTEVPDTVLQDKPFEVIYTLTTKGTIKGYDIPRFKGGFTRTDISYNWVTTTPPFTQLKITVKYRTSQAGTAEVPIIEIPLNSGRASSDRKAIFVKANKEYGKEMDYAHHWLINNGQHPDSISLEMICKDKGFYIFSDVRNKCFCIVAEKNIWQMLYTPVLAYSKECSYYKNYIGTRQSDGLLEPFRIQIAVMSSSTRNNQSASVLYVPKHREVKPLLKNTRWSQGSPYNRLAPTINGKKVWAGCVPTATALVMSYYRWPEQGTSYTHYLFNQNQIATVDFTTCKPQWKVYKDSYEIRDSLDEGLRDLSKLLFFWGLSLDAKFSNSGSGAPLRNVKHTLCDNLGYSGHISYFENHISEDQTESLLYKEIDEGRPCIVSNHGHAFVCDGYKDGFMHYNLGWGGQFNGYYKLRIGQYKTPANDKKLILVKELICGIEPQRDSVIVREIEIKKTGSLEKLLTDQEKETIGKLTIIGKLNSKDIKLLRKMAGANDEVTIDGWRGGALRELNLRKAKIAGNIIDERMFAYCSSLTSIILPIGTEDIGHYAFTSCTSLKTIVLPPNTSTLGADPFAYCTSLEKITVPRHLAFRSQNIGKGCSPILVIPAY